MNNLHSVTVQFTDDKYNYETSVSSQTTPENAKDYFVNAWFNVGRYPAENMQKCISIKFTN